MKIKMRIQPGSIQTIINSSGMHQVVNMHRADCPDKHENVSQANLSLRIDGKDLFGKLEEDREYWLELTPIPKETP